MQAEIVTVGSEILSGKITNTNATYLTRRLTHLGIRCNRQVSVPDDQNSLINALREAITHSELVVITGGLGPTFDDITMASIALATHRPLTYYPTIANRIRIFYSSHQRKLQQSALRQAYLPRDGKPIPNTIGTAAGLWLNLSKTRTLIALPGVPSEMKSMMEHFVLPRLEKNFIVSAFAMTTLRTTGIVELSIEQILKRIPMASAIELGLYPNLRSVDIRISVRTDNMKKSVQVLKRFEKQLRKKLGTFIYGVNEQSLESVVGSLLLKSKKSLALAESCTGGMITKRLTDIPGSSRYLKGAIIAYHNDIKHSCLQIPKSTLKRFGAVSAQTAALMAEGVRKEMNAGLGLAVTGIAGPTGGTKQKPVGLIYLGLSDRKNTQTLRMQFLGDRRAIRKQTAQAALDWLRRYLTGLKAQKSNLR